MLYLLDQYAFCRSCPSKTGSKASPCHSHYALPGTTEAPRKIYHHALEAHLSGARSSWFRPAPAGVPEHAVFGLKSLFKSHHVGLEHLTQLTAVSRRIAMLCKFALPDNTEVY